MSISIINMHGHIDWSGALWKRPLVILIGTLMSALFFFFCVYITFILCLCNCRHYSDSDDHYINCILVRWLCQLSLEIVCPQDQITVKQLRQPVVISLVKLILRKIWESINRGMGVFSQFADRLEWSILDEFPTRLLRSPAGRQMKTLPMPISQQPFNRSWPNFQQFLLWHVK